MNESENGGMRVLSEAVMLARLNRSDEMRKFVIEIWKQNPALAKQGGVRVQNLISTVESKQRGISLIELIIFIVIISIALTGILLVMNQVTRHSADPLIRKQAIAAAESLLEEIELQDFSMPSGVVATSGTVDASNRTAGYHIISDYHNGDFTDGSGNGGIASINGSTILANYSASVNVQSPLPADWNGVLAASAALITVTVTDPQGTPISISGYRMAY